MVIRSTRRSPENLREKKVCAAAGFTLAELLIVVAIIALLVAIVIPVFSVDNEKTARTVDVANAKALESMLRTMYLTGDIVWGEREKAGAVMGVFIVVARDKDHLPKNYDDLRLSGLKLCDTLYCGADKNVVFQGEVSKDWNLKHSKLHEAVKECFDSREMRSVSDSDVQVGGISGWDWYLVQLYLDKDGQTKSRIFSGMKGDDSGITSGVGKTTTNIEKYMRKF